MSYLNYSILYRVLIRKMHELWYEGLPDEGVRPFRFFTSKDFYGVGPDEMQQKKRLSQATIMMKEINKYLVIEDYQNRSHSEQDLLFTEALAKLTVEFSPIIGSKRGAISISELHYTSLYENYLLKLKRL